jgi:hypothetical protein
MLEKALERSDRGPFITIKPPKQPVPERASATSRDCV